MELAENYFTAVDYAVVLLTLVGSLCIGVLFAIKKQTTEDLLIGGRNMGPWSVAASMLATYLSSIAILGYPSEVYYHGVEIFIVTLMQIFIAPLAAYTIVPVIYKMKLTSVFKYLEQRFDSVLSRWIGAAIGVIQIFFFMGVVLFAPSIALQQIVGIPYWVSIIGIGLCGTAYTSVGGLKAVVWTDVFQLVMIIFSLSSIIFSKAFSSEGGIIQAFKVSAEHGRLNLFNFAVDPFMRHNTLNFVLGFGFTIFCNLATHQPQVQRYSSLPTLQAAQKAVLAAVPMSIVTIGLIMVTGIVIYGNYASCDPYKSRKISFPDQIVPYYVVKELSMVPGMLGMFISCIFSAVLSTVSTALNCSAAITWEDFLVRIPVFAKMTEKSKANTTRILAAIYGGVGIGFAFCAQGLGPVLPLAMSITGATGGPLGAIFLIGLFLPWVNKYGANTGMLVGICSMFFASYRAFRLGTQHIPLPTSTEGCLEDFVARNQTRKAVETLEWPEKMFAISYLLFPMMGAIITVLVSLIVSAVTGGFCSMQKVNPNYLHPCVRNSICCVEKPEMLRDLPLIEMNGVVRSDGETAATPAYTYGSSAYKYSAVPTTPNPDISEEPAGESLLLIKCK